MFQLLTIRWVDCNIIHPVEIKNILKVYFQMQHPLRWILDRGEQSMSSFDHNGLQDGNGPLFQVREVLDNKADSTAV